MLREIVLAFLFSLVPAAAAAEAVPSMPPAPPYVIAASANSPPYSYRDQTGEPRGILVDFWRLWARKSNASVSFSLADWEETLALVRDGKAHFHAGLFHSDRRAEYLDFSAGTIDNTISLFILDRLAISSIEELREIPVAVGINREYFAVDYVRKQYPFIPVLLFPNNEALLNAATNRQILAFAVDYPVAVFYLSRSDALGQFRVLEHLITFPLRAGVRKGNTELLATINSGLRLITRSEREQLLDNWGLRESVKLPLWARRLLLAGVPAALFLALILHSVLLRREVRRKTIQLRAKTETLESANREMARMSRTEQGRLEQLERISREKDNLLKLVAQGLRAPIREVVALCSEVSARQEAVKRIELRGTEMLRLMDRILQLSRLEQDAYRLQMQRVDLRKFLEEHRRAFQEMGRVRGITVRIDLPPEPLKADIHPEHFEEICRNLLSNAVKFSTPGGAVVLSLRRASEGEARAVLQISDSGIGIPEREIPGLFEGFNRVGKDAPGEGTIGMGLAVVKQLLDWHGGTISVASEEGNWTTFTVTLPVPQEYSRPYEEVAMMLQTGDIILFKGPRIDNYGRRTAAPEWTHLGLVVRVPTAGGPLLWESTPDETVEDRTLRMVKSGAQLVPLRDRLAAYDTNVYAVRHLNAPREEPMVRNLYRFIYEIHRLPFPNDLEVIRRVIGARYFRRILRPGRFKNVFCSELVAESYMRMGLLPKSPPSSAYLPEDFSIRKTLPFLRGAYLGPEIRIEPPESRKTEAASNLQS